MTHMRIHPHLAGQLTAGRVWAITPEGRDSLIQTMAAASADPRAYLAEMAPRIRERDRHRGWAAAVVRGDRSAWAESVWTPGDPTFDAATDPHIIRTRKGLVGVLPIVGPLMSRAGWCWEGYDSYTGYGRSLIEGGCTRLVLRMDTPGGACQGLSAFCAEIRQWRALGVEVFAVVDHDCHSAGYAAASQADLIYVSPDSLTGQAGTYMSWVDISEHLRSEGIRSGYIEMPDGGLKTAWAGDDTERAASDQDRRRDELWRPVVQHFFRAFMADIEAGRGDRLTGDDAAGTLARIYPGLSAAADGRNVIEAGLADAEATYEQLMTELGATASAQEAA